MSSLFEFLSQLDFGFILLFIGAICSSTCGAAFTALPEAYADPCVPQTRSNCFTRIFMATCELFEGDSMNDATALAALKTAEKIRLFENVDVVPQTPTQIIYKRKGCRGSSVKGQKQIFDLFFEDVAADHTDEIFWKEICQLGNKITWGLIFSDDYTVANQAWVEHFLAGGLGTTPNEPLGINATVLEVPHLLPFVEDEPPIWKMQIEVYWDCTYVSALAPNLIPSID